MLTALPAFYALHGLWLARARPHGLLVLAAASAYLLLAGVFDTLLPWQAGRWLLPLSYGYLWLALFALIWLPACVRPGLTRTWLSGKGALFLLACVAGQTGILLGALHSPALLATYLLSPGATTAILYAGWAFLCACSDGRSVSHAALFGCALLCALAAAVAEPLRQLVGWLLLIWG
ncbi:hypothetical protein [Crenobacter caeni]|uniref:Uncharacterized protein n=1 Tax=Crenobacter caeni TaxID=2705474 RepID=A0A6B2KQD4_9NEIS|nr:hypothetical protein [Crenobacter caeni]NDV12452.1 hypothetical protein [Crenobacter caeni]